MLANGRSKSSQRKQLLIYLGLVGLLIAVTWTVVSRSQTNLIEFKSLQIANVVARQASLARSVYSSIAVAKLKSEGHGAASNSRDIPGTIPLPAQFLKELAHRTQADSGGTYKFKPVSRWNLDPGQGVVDEFQRWAWDKLAEQDRTAPAQPIDWQPVWRIETVAGVETLRFMRADPASSKSCVDCHNALENLPQTIATRKAAGVEVGRQWNVNELLGAIEITIPIDQSSALAREQTANGLMVIAVVTITGLLIMMLFSRIDTTRRQAMTERLEYQSSHDFLTSLPNRFGFEKSLSEINEDRKGDPEHVVMLLDLDDFKRINDTLGHDVGDEVLKETAKRLRSLMRPQDHMARLGGDEFAVLLPRTSREEAAAVAGLMSAELDREITVSEYELRSGASIGIAVMPENGSDLKAVLRCADVAMYVAKRQRSNFEFYDVDKDENQVSTLSLISDFRASLARNELEMHYQPKVDLATRQVTCVEALLRWEHPVHGKVVPDEIVRVAERCGSIRELTKWTLVSSLQQLRQWHEHGHTMDVAVNLSAQMLNDREIIALVSTALATTEVSPKNLILEITESSMMTDPTLAGTILDELSELGVRISVDDFGTGYSSLSYIHQLPLDELKLDRSFVSDLPGSERNRHIVIAALQLAHSLELKLVAEGVETRDTLDYLQEIGCDMVQGYFLCRPIPGHEIAEALPQVLEKMQPPYGPLRQVAA